MSGVRLFSRWLEDTVLEVDLLLEHPMEPGTRTDAAGTVIPARLLEEIKLEHNAQLAARLHPGAAISSNARLGVRLEGVKAGDQLKLSWRDSDGREGSRTLKVLAATVPEAGAGAAEEPSTPDGDTD